MSNSTMLFFLAISIGIVQIQTTASHVIPRLLVPACKAMFPSSNVSPLDCLLILSNDLIPSVILLHGGSDSLHMWLWARSDICHEKNHLNCFGKTSLQARLVVRLLKRNTQQQPESTPLLQRGFKKQASSNFDRDNSCKQHKAAQLEENQLPEIAASSQLETDLIEDLLPPVAADTDRQGRFIERSWGIDKNGAILDR